MFCNSPDTPEACASIAAFEDPADDNIDADLSMKVCFWKEWSTYTASCTAKDGSAGSTTDNVDDKCAGRQCGDVCGGSDGEFGDDGCSFFCTASGKCEMDCSGGGRINCDDGTDGKGSSEAANGSDVTATNSQPTSGNSSGDGSTRCSGKDCSVIDGGSSSTTLLSSSAAVGIAAVAVFF